MTETDPLRGTLCRALRSGDRQAPAPLALVGLEELASALPSGNRKFHFFKTKEDLREYLTSIDGEADVLKLVRPLST
jgi:hypothetical protein